MSGPATLALNWDQLTSLCQAIVDRCRHLQTRTPEEAPHNSAPHIDDDYRRR